MASSCDRTRETAQGLLLTLLGIAACGAGLVWTTPAVAKDCEYGINCPVPEEDGCCPAPKGKVAREFYDKLRKAGKPGEDSAAKNKKKAPGCAEGQIKDAGHCCWQGQSWDKAQDRCVGAAEVCPEGYSQVGRGCRKPADWVQGQAAGLSFLRSEVTVADYKDCLAAGGCVPGNHFTKADNKYCNFEHKDRRNHPMNCVGWVGSQDYCKWIGGRLPTQDEWLAEATGGGQLLYPWGNEPTPDCKRTIWGGADGKGGCGKRSTWPVCSKPDGNTSSGICDLSGNVWEWTTSTTDDGDAWMVILGGSWLSDTIDSLEMNYRSGQDPATAWVSTGFRCVR